MDKGLGAVISEMPEYIREEFCKIKDSDIQEIRFRVGRPAMLYCAHGIKTLKRNITYKDLERLITAFCSNSLYAHCNTIREGYITSAGGNRIGIAGRAVYKDGVLSNITDFTGINIRIARQITGAAKDCIDYISNGKTVRNTLVISPPGGGKTTLLRDIARMLGENFKVVIVDERSEIGAQEKGSPGFDVGIHTDILDGFSKEDGIRLAIRSLSPQVIITDEIGTESDILAIKNIIKSGAAIITSIHADDFEELLKKKRLLVSLFDVAVVLEKRRIKKCIKLWEQ